MELKYFKLHDDVKDPVFSTKQSACFDVHAYLGHSKSCLIQYYDSNNVKQNGVAMKDTHLDEVKSFKLKPGERALIPTGLIFDIPEGYSVRGHSRSGLALKEGLVLANGEAVIDSDYIQETFIILVNISDRILSISHGQKIAQLELVRLEGYTLTQTDVQPIQKTDRVGGFGSTGR